MKPQTFCGILFLFLFYLNFVEKTEGGGSERRLKGKSTKDNEESGNDSGNDEKSYKKAVIQGKGKTKKDKRNPKKESSSSEKTYDYERTKSGKYILGEIPHLQHPFGQDIGTPVHQTSHQNPSMEVVAQRQLGHIIPGFNYNDRNPNYLHQPHSGSPPDSLFYYDFPYNTNISNEDENDEDGK
uniref:Uncharacterized protein n=1 Tax=Meloidogyne javanica TaxID=6303 RepID=A0A915M6G7_MELJA